MSKIRYEEHTFEELVIMLEAADRNQLLFRVEHKGKSFVLPAEFLELLNDEYKFVKPTPGNSAILLPSEEIAIAATTVVTSSYFGTMGYRYLMLGVVNPTWVTNPNSITVVVLFSADNGVTVQRLSVTATGADQTFLINKEDLQMRCYFIPVIEVGDKEIAFCPFPSVNENTKIALEFTPAGTAESKNISIVVYGVR